VFESPKAGKAEMALHFNIASVCSCTKSIQIRGKKECQSTPLKAITMERSFFLGETEAANAQLFFLLSSKSQQRAVVQ
jgi:hypothetical protein